MANTTAQDVIDSFESSFADKQVLPDTLEINWLKKAVARYSIEIDPVYFDSDTLSFDYELDQYVIDTIASIMKQFYMERQYSKVNKTVSIVGKDLSIDGSGTQKTNTKKELDYSREQASDYIENQKPSAFV